MLPVWGLCRGFLQWWLDEHRRFITQRLFPGLFPGEQALVFACDGTKVSLGARTRGLEIALGELAPQAGEDDLIAALVALAKDRDLPLGTGRPTLIARLPSASALQQNIVVPDAAGENLRQVLSWDIDRLTPFTAAEACFAWRPATGAAGSGRLKGSLAVVARARIDETLALLARRGIAVDRVEVAWSDNAAEGAWVAYAREAEPAAQRRSRLQRAVVAGLAGVTVLLAVAVMVHPFWRQQRQLTELADKLQIADREAATAQATRDEVERLDRQASFLIEARSGRSDVLQVLLELTQLTPDDTWLERLRHAGDTVEIVGHSAAASALVAAMEQSPLFAGAQFRSPVTRDAQSEVEAFHLALRVTPRDAP
jgi:general secretion pathway protein L